MTRKSMGLAILAVTGIAFAGLIAIIASEPSPKKASGIVSKMRVAPAGRFDQKACAAKVAAICGYHDQYENFPTASILALELIREIDASDATAGDLVDSFEGIDRMLDLVGGRGGCDSALQEALFARCGQGFRLETRQYGPALRMFEAMVKSNRSTGRLLPIFLAFGQLDRSPAWQSALARAAESKAFGQSERADQRFAREAVAQIGKVLPLRLESWPGEPKAMAVQNLPVTVLLARSPIRYQRLARLADASKGTCRLVSATLFDSQGGQEFAKLAEYCRVPLYRAEGGLADSLPNEVDYIVFYCDPQMRLVAMDDGLLLTRAKETGRFPPSSQTLRR